MRAVVVVVGALLVASLAHAAPSSTLTAPPGWTEDTSGNAALASVKSKPGILRADLRQWNAPDASGALQHIEIEAKFDGEDLRALIDGMERGANTGAGSATKLSYAQREENNVLIVDHVIETNGRRVHLRRYYAVDSSDHVHNATVTCIGPAGAEDPPACAPAYASFSWTIHPVELPKARGLAGHMRSLGIYAGIAAVVVLIVVWVIRRKR